MKIKLKKIKEGQIFMPEAQLPHIRCSECSTTIIKTNLPNGKLTLVNDLPICVRCRIIKTSKFSDTMQHTDEYKKDQEALGEVLQKKANDNVIEVAYNSQRLNKNVMISS